jgi:hypothetical protein
MKQKQLIDQIVERLNGCRDTDMLDLILKLLVESGY